MNQRFPQDSSAETLEGDAAHWVGWEILAGRKPLIGTICPNSMSVSDEMLEGGELLVETIRNVQIGKSYEAVETKLAVPFGTDNFGTPDYWNAATVPARINIVDYKFGHRFVDEFWNLQGLCYLAAILQFLGWSAENDAYIEVSFTVVQPRCFYKGAPVRTHTFKLSEVRSHFNHLAQMAKAAAEPAPVATTNEHCGDCPGRHACSALQLAAYNDAEYSNARTPLELSPAAAALELRLLMRALARLEARVEGLKEFTLANIKKGERVPYFRVEPGYGRTQWNVPDGQVIALGQMFGHNLSKPGIVTPNQALKLGVDESIVKAHSFTPSTAAKLVAETASDAPKVFGKGA